MSNAISMPRQSTVKIRFVCAQEYKNRFASSHCLVSVSVGQAKHEGEKLKATLAKVNQNFNHCTIMLADSLQRYNLKLLHPNSSWASLHSLANQLGDEWLQRNYEAIADLTIPINIIRWDSWLKNPEFEANKCLVDDLYANNFDFRMSIFNAIKAFLMRMEQNGKIFDRVAAYKNSAEFIKEECAAQMLMTKKGYDFEVYPSKRLGPLEFIHESLIKPFNPNLMNQVKLEIKSSD